MKRQVILGSTLILALALAAAPAPADPGPQDPAQVPFVCDAFAPEDFDVCLLFCEMNDCTAEKFQTNQWIDFLQSMRNTQGSSVGREPDSPYDDEEERERPLYRSN